MSSTDNKYNPHGTHHIDTSNLIPIEWLLLRGISLPPEIQQSFLVLKLNKTREEKYEIIIKTLWDNKKDYQRDRQIFGKNEDHHCNFKCRKCNGVISAVMKGNGETQMLIGGFDFAKHNCEDETYKRMEHKYYKELSQKYNDIKIDDSKNARFILPNPRMVSTMKDTDIVDYHLDIVDYFKKVEDNNEDMKCGFSERLSMVPLNEKREIFLKEYIHNPFVILPSSARLNNLLSTIGIDGTYNRRYECTMVLLTGRDQMKHNIPLAIVYIPTENSADLIPFLRIFKDYLVEKEVEVNRMKIISDRSGAIGNALAEVFDENICYYDTFHLNINFIRFTRQHHDIKIGTHQSSTINGLLHEISNSWDPNDIRTSIESISITLVSIKFDHIKKVDDLMTVSKDEQKKVIEKENQWEIECIQKGRKKEQEIIQMKEQKRQQEIERIVKEHRDYFEEMKAITYYFIYAETKVEFWIPLHMDHDPCRYGYTSNQGSEATNDSVSKIKDMKVVQSAEYLQGYFNNKMEELSKEKLLPPPPPAPRLPSPPSLLPLQSLPPLPSAKPITKEISTIMKKDKVETLIQQNDDEKEKFIMRGNVDIKIKMEIRNDHCYFDVFMNEVSHHVYMNPFRNGYISWCNCGVPQIRHVDCEHILALKGWSSCPTFIKNGEYIDDRMTWDSHQKFYEELKIQRIDLRTVGRGNNKIITADTPKEHPEMKRLPSFPGDYGKVARTSHNPPPIKEQEKSHSIKEQHDEFSICHKRNSMIEKENNSSYKKFIDEKDKYLGMYHEMITGEKRKETSKKAMKKQTRKEPLDELNEGMMKLLSENIEQREQRMKTVVIKKNKKRIQMCQDEMKEMEESFLSEEGYEEMIYDYPMSSEGKMIEENEEKIDNFDEWDDYFLYNHDDEKKEEKEIKEEKEEIQKQRIVCTQKERRRSFEDEFKQIKEKLPSLLISKEQNDHFNQEIKQMKEYQNQFKFFKEMASNESEKKELKSIEKHIKRFIREVEKNSDYYLKRIFFTMNQETRNTVFRTIICKTQPIGTIKDEESMMFNLFLKEYGNDGSSELMIVKVNNQNPDDLIPIVRDTHRKKIFLIPQHIDANNDPDIIDLEEETTKEGEQEPIPRIGHWILTVYVRRTNEIFVLNSLPSYVPKTYLIKEAFPTAKMIFLSALPRQVGGVECGYWCWFFCFLFYIGTVTLENIENYIGHLAKEYFQRIKEIIKSIPLKAERHIPDDYKEFIHQKIRESHQRERRQKNGNK